MIRSILFVGLFLVYATAIPLNCNGTIFPQGVSVVADSLAEIVALCKKDSICSGLLSRSYVGKDPYARATHERAMMHANLGGIGLPVVVDDALSLVSATAQTDVCENEPSVVAEKLLLSRVTAVLQGASHPCEANEYARTDEATGKVSCACAADRVCGVKAYSRLSEENDAPIIVLAIFSMLTFVLIAFRLSLRADQDLALVQLYLSSQGGSPTRTASYLMRS